MSEKDDVHKREQAIITERRKERLEAEMKANLKRRKEQARARRQGTAPLPQDARDSEGPPGGESGT